MQVSKWGNSLPIRIPNVVVEALQLKEGDEVEITVAGTRKLGVDRDRRWEKALEAMRRLARFFPPGWKLHREEANRRGVPRVPPPADWQIACPTAGGMKAGKPFFDTNVIIYAFQKGASHQPTALDLLAEGGVTSVQVLNEFASVARRKLDFTWAEIEEAVASIRVLLPDPAALQVQTHVRAIRLAQRFGFSIHDGLIAATALETGCRVLYTEDMQSGQKIEGLTVRNPFL